MGTVTLAPGLEGTKPVELGEAGVLPAPLPAPLPEPEPEPELEPDPELEPALELGVLKGTEETGVLLWLLHLALEQGAVEVTVTVEAAPVTMWGEPVMAPVASCISMDFSCTAGSSCLKTPAWAPAVRARRATEAENFILLEWMELKRLS